MSPVQKFLLLVAAPTVVGLAIVEAAVLARRRRYDWRSGAVSVLDLFARIVLETFVPLSIATPLVAWAYRHRVATLEIDGWVAVLLLFVGQEFCYYWYHRSAHRVRWFWANHAVHHSSNELNLAAALRIGILGKLTGTSLFFVPLIWAGFPPFTIFAIVTLNLFYQFWIHTTWIPKLGWLEYVINTPSAHRVHHASNAEYIDANYGGVLIVFDRLFGTYVAERADLPCRYGLVEPMTSYNPLRIEFAQWIALARDLRRARRPSTIVGHLFRPPAWSPGDPARIRASADRTHGSRETALIDASPAGRGPG